jgi:hypothetical protein
MAWRAASRSSELVNELSMHGQCARCRLVRVRSVELIGGCRVREPFVPASQPGTVVQWWRCQAWLLFPHPRSQAPRIRRRRPFRRTIHCPNLPVRNLISPGGPSGPTRIPLRRRALLAAVAYFLLSSQRRGAFVPMCTAPAASGRRRSGLLSTAQSQGSGRSRRRFRDCLVADRQVSPVFSW